MGLYLLNFHVKHDLFMKLGSLTPLPRSKANVDHVFQILPNHIGSSPGFVPNVS
jgi:hypothetical protein